MTTKEEEYISKSLQWNQKRYQEQAELISRMCSHDPLRLLDIGCGGGLFLSLMSQRGAEVQGIELNDCRILFARKHYGLDPKKIPVEDSYWKSRFHSYFDVVTLWDVIEHVNYPLQTLQAASLLLKPGGRLVLDTPHRGSPYHTLGALTYRLTFGRYPTLLNMMYSGHPFGHKQIFSMKEMRVCVEHADLRVISLSTFAERQFPIEFYLRKLLRRESLALKLGPYVSALLKLISVKNKMIMVAERV